METIPKNVWKRISRVFPAEDADAGIAAGLFREYESADRLNRPAEQLLGFGTPVIADFFRRMSMMHSLESPILRRRDTRWMNEFDYTLVNIRAAGTRERCGTFLTAALFLATLRTRGIITAPVTRGPTENLLVQESHAAIRADLADGPLRDAGISAEYQVTAFCEAAHMLGLAVGYDLDYRVDPMAAVVLNRPELFLWTKDGLFNPDEGVQNELREDARQLVASGRKAGTPIDKPALKSAFEETGLRPRPSSDGSGRVPLALRMSVGDDTWEHRDAAVGYWGRVFDLWRDRYGFDFLVLRGTRGSGSDKEIPDRSLVRKAADAARKLGVRRNVGVAAEGDPLDTESFGIQGVDMVLGGGAEAKADMAWFREVFALDDRLRRINLGRKIRFSAAMEISPGETESRPARERALMKRFIARFLGVGLSRRPLLEPMGALEGAWGYESALETSSAMGWMPDPEDAERNRHIEEVARRHGHFTEYGECLEKYADERTAWWVIRAKKGLLVAVVSVENENLLPPEPLRIDCSQYIKEAGIKSLLEFDFFDDRGSLRLSAGPVIETGKVPYRGFRLYEVI